MTDFKQEDVMRALECCSSTTVVECCNCPYAKQPTDDFCANRLLKDAIALLREKDKEIERLEAEVAQVRTELNHATNLGCEAYETARSEAVSEFAERLYPLYEVLCVDEGDWRNEVDKIAEELKGELA